MNDIQSINIETPCSEDWSKMTRTEQGRHCLSCDKIVIDFEQKSTEEIIQYFNRHSSTSTCGRFSKTQLYSVNLVRHQPPQIITLRYFLTIGLIYSSSLLFAFDPPKEDIPRPKTKDSVAFHAPILDNLNLVQKDTSRILPNRHPTSLGIMGVVISKNHSLNDKRIKDDSTTVEAATNLDVYKGKVINENGRPLQFAQCLVKDDSNNVITGSVTDEFGNFSMNISKKDKPTIAIFSYVGKTRVTVKSSDLKNKTKTIVMESDSHLGLVGIVISKPRSFPQRIKGKIRRLFRGKSRSFK